MDFLKRILTIALCSILLVCACPTFSSRSEAAEAALTTEFLRSAIGYLSGYLVSKGYSIAQNSSFDVDSALEVTFPVQYQIYESFMEGYEAYSSAHAALLRSALERAYNSGVFSLSEEVDSSLTSYFDSITTDSSLIFGASSERFDYISKDEAVSVNVDFIDTSLSNSPTYNNLISLKSTYDYLPVRYDQFDGNGLLYMSDIYLLPSTPITTYSAAQSALNSFTLVETNNSNYGFRASKWISSSSVNGVTYYYIRLNIDRGNSRYLLQNYTSGSYLSILNTNDLASIYAYLMEYGYFEYSSEWTSSQLIDTSEKDILSSASEVDPETGAVSGGFTMYMRDWSLFQQILKQFSSGILSWTQAIKALGLSQVSADATPAEKESALDKVAYPDSTYDWFTTTTWDNGVTQTVKDEVATAHETELDIADELAETLNGGNDPSDEDKNKAGNAMLLATLLMYLGLWDPPGFDPENPGDPGIGDTPTTDPTSRGMLVETLTGMAVAGGLMDDLWDSVGGSQGLGIIFTVGASFVVFSVIVGGSNYLGALQSPDISNNNVDISNERSRIPQNNVPLLPTSKKSRRRK